MNNAQIEAIKYLIIKSKDASELAKKTLMFLLEQPDALQISICATIAETAGFSKKDVLDIYKGIHDMKSPNRTTHLNEVMKAAGSNFLFFICTETEEFKTEEKNKGHRSPSYTIWLSRKRYDPTAKKKDLSKETLLEVELSSGLYEKTR